MEALQMEQEVVQSCLKGSFCCKEPEKTSGKATGNRNRRSLIRVGIEKWEESRQERLSVLSSVGMGLSSFITCLYSTCHGGDRSDDLQVLSSMQYTSLTASSQVMWSCFSAPPQLWLFRLRRPFPSALTEFKQKKTRKTEPEKEEGKLTKIFSDPISTSGCLLWLFDWGAGRR